MHGERATDARRHSSRDRFTGCLVGLAVGDALGAPLEGLKEGHIRQIFGEVSDYADSVAAFPDRPGRWRLKGLYADETQQALAVADTLAIHGKADSQALADLYVRLAQEGPPGAEFGAHRGCGYVFRRAVGAMRDAGDPRRCGQASADNGAAVRVIPVGLYYAADDEALGRAVVDVSLMTHRDPRAIAAALAVARVVGWFSLGEECPVGPHPENAARALPSWLHEWEERLVYDHGRYLDGAGLGDERTHHFSASLRSLPSLLREANDRLAAQTIVREANACGPDQPIAQPHDGFALASVVAALYRGLAARSFSTALLAAVNGGGDADTVGAIVGAIAGARFGEEAIPPRWVAGLLNADQVRLRALALREREVDWTAWQDLVEMEKALTAREQEWVARTRGEHRREIEERRERLADRRERAARAVAAAPAPDPGFAPPPQVWLRGKRGAERDEIDPLRAKKEKTLRGRKRIGWKDERRRTSRG